MPRVFSGIQPTGQLHLGNYLGAIRNWVAMQETHDCLFGLMDLHAITVPQEPEALRHNIRFMAAALIACGIDPEKHILFPQSAVSGHSELAWILGCHTPLGWLNRMTQFKEKAGKKREQAVLGLYGYPVLMAADILLYHATHVPVGDDQKQHLELARDIAAAFNRYYESEIFILPEPVMMPTAARVMSLRDGRSKMSKSDPSDMTRINLTDDDDVIAQKFRKCRTDAEHGVSYDPENRPEVSNLAGIFAGLSDRSVASVCTEYADAEFSRFKEDLAALAVEKIAPIRMEIRHLMEDFSHIDRLLHDGAARAGTLAGTTMRTVQDKTGLVVL